MRSLRLAESLLAFVAAFAAYGCALDVAGLSPNATSTGSGAGAGPSGVSSSGPGGGTTLTGGAGGTGATTTTTGTSTSCASPTEVCDDGIDNNCDGMIDCADPQCATPVDGRACVPDAPIGWAFTAVTPGMAAACPAGYDTPVPVAPPPTSASATCDCNCGALVSNPCTQGSLTVKIGGNCSTNTVTSNVTGGCDPFGSPSPGSHQSCGGNALKAVPVSCSLTLSKPNQVPSSVEMMCAPVASSALGCDAGKTCLPKAMSAKLCIQANQDMACPPGPYTVRSVVGTPGDVADTRACGACTCTSDATTCANATFTAYTDAGCSMSATSVAIDGGCHNGGNGQSFSGDTHFVYQATPNLTTCTPSAAKPALSGGFQPNNPITICCQP